MQIYSWIVERAFDVKSGALLMIPDSQCCYLKTIHSASQSYSVIVQIQVSRDIWEEYVVQIRPSSSTSAGEGLLRANKIPLKLRTTINQIRTLKVGTALSYTETL